MISYLGKPDLKAAFLGEIRKHEQMDVIIQGTYGEWNGAFRGCAIGCSLHSLNVLQGKPDAATDDHRRYESELGIPIWLAYIEDNIFECLLLSAARTWPRQFAEAVPVGVTIPDVLLAKILRWTLGAETYGCRHAATDPAVVAVVDRMIALFDREIRGDSPTSVEWDEAAWAAWAAGDVWAARAAWAAWAAWDAWDAWAAWAAWAAGDARDAFYPALAAYVLQELAALQPEKLR